MQKWVVPIIGTYTKVFGEVKNSIVFRASIIEEDTKLDNCVSMQGEVIKKGAKISNIILEKSAIVGEGADYHGIEKKPLIIIRLKIYIWIMKKQKHCFVYLKGDYLLKKVEWWCGRHTTSISS